MHKTWPKLLKRIKAGKARNDSDERELVISTRTWFCLYIFEHQYVRPESSLLLDYKTFDSIDSLLELDVLLFSMRMSPSRNVAPFWTTVRFIILYMRMHAYLPFLRIIALAIPDDIRLVSMVELAVIRERLHHSLSSTSSNSSSNSDVYTILNRAKEEFQSWFGRWDEEFSKRQVEPGYQNFQRQSLEVQRYFAELFHNATALRGIRGPDDVSEMPAEQRALALHSIQIAKAGLDLCLRTQNYKEGLKYGLSSPVVPVLPTRCLTHFLFQRCISLMLARLLPPAF